MRGQKLPDRDHIARLCPPKTAPNGIITGAAFLLKPEEDGLSVNWLEFLNCSCREDEIKELRRIYKRKFNRVSKASRIAVLNVGTTCNTVFEQSPDNRRIVVHHQPDLPNDPSHSEVFNLRDDDELIAELIRRTVQENHPAIN
jgi:hypothetical protein